MLFDHISHLGRYAGLTRVYTALQALAAIDPAHPPKEQVNLPGGIYYNAIQLTTRPPEDCRYEAHNRYIDVHYTLSGTERIDVQDRGSLTPLEELFPGKDIGFYQGEAAARCLVRPGWFLVCFPEDAHKVAMAEDAPEDVEKIVVKVPV